MVRYRLSMLQDFFLFTFYYFLAPDGSTQHKSKMFKQFNLNLLLFELIDIIA